MLLKTHFILCALVCTEDPYLSILVSFIFLVRGVGYHNRAGEVQNLPKLGAVFIFDANFLYKFTKKFI